MKSIDNHFILTGSTGVLGSHLMYELMLRIHESGYTGQLILLIRSKSTRSIQDRFDDLLIPDLMPDYMKQLDIARLKKDHIQLINYDITNATDVTHYLENRPESYHLIHCAASVNLGTTPGAYEEIKRTNYYGTIQLIKQVRPYIFKVTYISTAFAFRPPFLKEQARANYRNHYEIFKAKIEEEIPELAEQYGLEWQILRPSIIAGRLIDSPYHVIYRFLVFYLFGAFFYRSKDAYGHMKIRIALNPKAGLNMVPVDYAAKVIMRALSTDINDLNIVHSRYMPNVLAVPTMLKAADWTNYEFVSEIPDDQNAIEKLYYRTAGAQLSQYLLADDYSFDMQVLRELMHDVEEPNLEENFPALCRYAADRKFKHMMD
ncbi:SDR family oxidoreductase [Larkinella sp. C7]|jgi:nucleoside-diphosphate-sugar epimerase|uniref:SDR family oxidoreductase n=1 Tax=Larkinella sp. C7 TaxID=2576607 RepID=UPI001111102F|nr:SDR family oxidoreductase [Larkinella sp. C7]